MSTRSQERVEIGQFVTKNTIKAIEPAHKTTSNVTINNVPVPRTDIQAHAREKQKKSQATLLTLYTFALNDKKANYLLKFRQAADGNLVEPVLISDHLSLPVDQCLTVHEQVKKLKTSVLGLLEKYERVLHTIREKADKQFNYRAIMVDNTTRLSEYTWLNLVHSRLTAPHSIESIYLEYDRCMAEFTQLNNTYSNLLGEYNRIDAEIKVFEKLNDTSLLSCSLAKYVNVKELDDFFTTDYLTSCLIVVPKTGVNEFLAEYASLDCEESDTKRKRKADKSGISANTNASSNSGTGASTNIAQQTPQDVETKDDPFLGVVPRSARRLKEDATHVLFSILLFKKDHQRCMDYFREKKWTVREYIPEEAGKSADSRLGTLTHVKADRERAFHQHVESTIASYLNLVVDIAVLELYVESQLRFGTDFQMIALMADGMTKKALKQVINYAMNSILNSCDQAVYDIDIETENPYLPFVFCSTKLADEAFIKTK